ncbi:MAG: 3-hydroxyacyl-CoA dehydrogenase NAD-binding domain-containing protein [Paenibacillus dendritiformis]|uniref:3-hydroxyacyl-CoA dehydrogenase family protein n=1 Tax=Paenibacillus dendritiformis TaxID=130049 RepID=UPI00143D737A|nr:3-hydroxyacyl-CoA dehydrogenase NAD-binding domain-containing protein [Paenibacillus dendritiformis]MDU5145590.1 3-hydroxyacyl-CoA dehydrogenase NAD-binding domain-containing protein [Paenibacillus dendritiformis]NKI22279.1 NAD-binding protein [Paenibacillus dendritiformis]NRF98771.1 NAD-binding protein [Paenibacillus dendritiformis]GIO72963.1 3-hydroxybutyryl-CoA dehydrogenase [Paenibacillus dendritiformis]
MSVIAVVGAGVMGVDVASTLSSHGYKVIVKDIDPAALQQIPQKIERNIRNYRMISPALREWDAEDILSRITVTNTYDHFAHVSWVIENITEDWEAKSRLYRELGEVCSEDTFYGVNTSCISPTKLASLLDKPDKVIGMHFMNPVPLKEIVETVRGYHTSQETIAAAEALLKSIGKQPILVEDSPGFVSNRLSHLFMNEAAFLVQEGVAEPRQIDLMFKKGYAHKMGPLETADLIGLDTVVRSLDVLYKEYGDSKFRCCTLLRKMVDAGLLGRKSGRGFYHY